MGHGYKFIVSGWRLRVFSIKWCVCGDVSDGKYVEGKKCKGLLRMCF